MACPSTFVSHVPGEETITKPGVCGVARGTGKKLVQTTRKTQFAVQAVGSCACRAGRLAAGASTEGSTRKLRDGRGTRPRSLKVLLETNEMRLIYSFSLIDNCLPSSEDPPDATGRSGNSVRSRRSSSARRGLVAQSMPSSEQSKPDPGRTLPVLGAHFERRRDLSCPRECRRVPGPGGRQVAGEAPVAPQFRSGQSGHLCEHRPRPSESSAHSRAIQQQQQQRDSYDDPALMQSSQPRQPPQNTGDDRAVVPQITPKRWIKVRRGLRITRLAGACPGPASAGRSFSRGGHEAGAVEPQRENTDNSAGTCSVCLGEYLCGEMIAQVKRRSCGHVFHNECILRWLVDHDDCPLCRKRIADIN